MTGRTGNTARTAAIVVLLLGAVAPWLLPFDRWWPDPAPAAQQWDAKLSAPLGRLISPPPRETFSAVIERPLFNASRRAPSAAPSAAGGGRMLLGRYRLSGVVITADRRLALLADAGGRHIKVEEGGELDGWRMLSISPLRLVLSRDDERLEYALTPHPGGTDIPNN